MEHSFFLVFFKQFFVAFFVALSGALAHALTEVKKHGWKGWVAFISDTFVCVFFGFIFHQLGSIIYPEYATIFTALGSFWGTESFKYLRSWIVKSLEANLPKT